MTTLLMSSRHTSDNQALWRAAVGRGWDVVRARGIHLPEIQGSEIILYLEALYAPTIAQQIGVRLLSPPDDWLPGLPWEFVKRRIEISNLGSARALAHPAFIKPPNDKSFSAMVHESGASLPEGFDDEMAVLVAEPVQWELEFRSFCLDGHVAAISPYSRQGDFVDEPGDLMNGDEIQEARRFTQSVLSADSTLPRAIVLDVGQIAGCGWAVVEANAAWGSGIYHCDPEAVLDVIRWASVPM